MSDSNDRHTIKLEPYEGVWPADDPDAGFRQMVREYSHKDPLTTLRRLSRNKNIPVGALVSFVLARYAASGAEALLAMEPFVVRQMGDIVRESESAGTDEARLKAYQKLSVMISWLRAPMDRPGWRPAESQGFPSSPGGDG